MTGHRSNGVAKRTGLSYGHMGGMRLRTNFAAENMVVTWRCGDRIVPKETYCVAYNLAGVWRIMLRPLRHFLTAGLRKLFFLPNSPHAPHHSALNMTTPFETSHADSGQNAHVTAPLWSYWPQHWSNKQIIKRPQSEKATNKHFMASY